MCFKKHLAFVGIAGRHLLGELVQLRWNGIKTLVVARVILYGFYNTICPSCTSLVVLFPSCMVATFAGLVVCFESTRYTVRLWRMYTQYIDLSQL